MTYPPQQQPDPWGQQQGPQDTWGQQQQPDAQWGQQPPPPQDPWGGGGGYDGYGPPPKKGGGKTLAIVLVIVVVLAGAGVGLFFWLKNKDSNDNAGPGGLNPNDPKSVAVAWADKYSKAYNSDYQEVKATDLKPLMCQSQAQDLDHLQQEADQQRARQSSGSAVPTPNHRKFKLAVGDVKANGDTATAMITATPESGSSDGPSGSAANSTAESRAFEMKKEASGWKVCGPQPESGGNGGSTGGGGIPTSGGGSLPSLPGGGGSGGGSGAPAPSGSMKPLPSGIPLPTH